MKLPDARETYYYNSQKVSDITRQLAFAALALIWLFRPDGVGQYAVPPILTCAGVAIVACLVLDFLQYVLSTLIWGIYQRVLELRFQKQTEQDIDEVEFLIPPRINLAADILFWLKIVPLLVAYFQIGKYLLSQPVQSV